MQEDSMADRVSLAVGRAIAWAAGALAVGLALAACDRPIPRVASRAIAPPDARSHPAELPTQRSEPRASPEPLRAAAPASDSLLTGRIKSAILSDPGMVGADVSVMASQGVVS